MKFASLCVCLQVIRLDRAKPSKSPTDDVAADVTSDIEMSPATELQTVTTLSPQNDVDEDSETQDKRLGDRLKPLRLELTPESQLDSTEPVCVELLDCNISVREVLMWLTSPSWCVFPSFDQS